MKAVRLLLGAAELGTRGEEVLGRHQAHQIRFRFRAWLPHRRRALGYRGCQMMRKRSLSTGMMASCWARGEALSSFWARSSILGVWQFSAFSCNKKVVRGV